MTDVADEQLYTLDPNMEEGQTKMADEVPAGTNGEAETPMVESGDAKTDVGETGAVETLNAGDTETDVGETGAVETLNAVDAETDVGETGAVETLHARDALSAEDAEIDDKRLIKEGNNDNTPHDEVEKNTDEQKDDEDPDWVDILGTGHLRKKVLCEGQGTDTRPARGQLVTIRSSGQVEGGGQVDCHEEIQFVLGDGDVVQAWDLAVTLMQLGEKALVFSKPRFAYGEEGRADDIPPNSNITYELELLKIEDKPNLLKLPIDQCCQMADQKRERGNELYSRKDYSNAINSYSKALEILGEIQASSEEQVAVDELKVKCYNNLAAAQLKVDAPNAALKSCNSVLDLRPKNVKALFRKGKVLATQFEYKEAVRIMKEALTLEPANRTIHQELSKLSARQNEEKQSEKELYQRMVGDMAKVSEIPEDQKIHKRQWLYAISVGVIGVAVLIGAIFASQT